MLKHITRDTQFYRRLWQLTVPISLTSLIGFGATLADTLMLGTLSEVHLSAAALGNQPGFVFMLFIIGMSGGASVLIAQYWGGGDVKSIQKIMALMYRMLIAGGIMFACATLLFSDRIMGIFTTDARVIREGSLFLRIIGFAFPMIGISIGSLAVLRSVGAVKIALFASVLSLSTKGLLNWLLIFGNLGAPRLEIEGAAIATVASRLVEFTIVCIYLLRVDVNVRFRLRYLFMSKLGMLKDYLRYGGPVFINEFIWGLGAAVLAVIIGRMGTEFTAANSITMTLAQFVTIVSFSMAFAASTIIGNTVGAGEYDKARVYGNTLTIISIATGLISFGLMQILKTPMLSLYNISETALIYSRLFIDVCSFLVIFQSAIMMMMIGVQRSGGDTKFVMVIDVIFMWTLSIPLGFLGGLQWGWSVPLVFFILRCDEFIKFFICLFRMKSGKWIKDVTHHE
jgi:putative MATE family efflux protein